MINRPSRAVSAIEMPPPPAPADEVGSIDFIGAAPPEPSGLFATGRMVLATPQGNLGLAVRLEAKAYAGTASDFSMSMDSNTFAGLGDSESVGLTCQGQLPSLEMNAVNLSDFSGGPIMDALTLIAAKWQLDADAVEVGLVTITVSGPFGVEPNPISGNIRVLFNQPGKIQAAQTGNLTPVEGSFNSGLQKQTAAEAQAQFLDSGAGAFVIANGTSDSFDGPFLVPAVQTIGSFSSPPPPNGLPANTPGQFMAALLRTEGGGGPNNTVKFSDVLAALRVYEAQLDNPVRYQNVLFPNSLTPARFIFQMEGSPAVLDQLVAEVIGYANGGSISMNLTDASVDRTDTGVEDISTLTGPEAGTVQVDGEGGG